MVHALEITRSLLKSDGLLIDIHPTGQPSQIEAHIDGEIHLAGPVREAGNCEKYFDASNALKDVTGRGLFELEREGRFVFLLHAPTIQALSDHIEAEWSDTSVSEKTFEQAGRLLGEPGEGAVDRSEIILREFVHIARFRVCGQ